MSEGSEMKKPGARSQELEARSQKPVKCVLLLLLATGYWLLAPFRPEVQKPGARSQEPEVGRLKPVNRLLFLLATGFWLLAPFLTSGCDYGVGGTGELVVPHEKLHDVDHLSFQPAPASQATTEPTTMPATEPAATSQELTIEEVRRDALANNLDLQVQLFAPTIASENLKAERQVRGRLHHRRQLFQGRLSHHHAQDRRHGKQEHERHARPALAAGHRRRNRPERAAEPG